VCISKTVEMFYGVIFSVAYFRVSVLLIACSYQTIVVYGSLDKIKLCDDGCIWVQMC
jgi:hypothetical protein